MVLLCHFSPKVCAVDVAVDLLRNTSGVGRLIDTCWVSCGGCRSVGRIKAGSVPDRLLWSIPELGVGAWWVALTSGCLGAIACVK